MAHLSPEDEDLQCTYILNLPQREVLSSLANKIVSNKLTHIHSCGVFIHSFQREGLLYIILLKSCLVARQDVCLQMNATSSISPSFIQFLCAF